MLIINISLLGCWTFLFLLCLNLPLCFSLLWESTKVRQAAGAGIYSLNPVMDYTALVLSNFTHTTHWFGYCGLFWQYCGSAVGLTECRHFDRLIKPLMFLCLHTFKRDKSDLSRLAFSFVISHHKMPSGCGSFCSVLFHLTLTQLHLFTASHNHFLSNAHRSFSETAAEVQHKTCLKGLFAVGMETSAFVNVGFPYMPGQRSPDVSWSKRTWPDLCATSPSLCWSHEVRHFCSRSLCLFLVHIVLLQVSTWLTWTRVLSIMSCCSNWKLKFRELCNEIWEGVVCAKSWICLN